MESVHEPFFSVIIPTFNRAEMLVHAINSVIEQTFTNWELIVVDDGSIDNTQEVVESFSDKRIIYIYQENEERSAARNKGIVNASGQYICFLDSDDKYLPHHLESFYKQISKSEYSFLYSLKINEEYIKCSSDYEQVFRSVIHSQQVCIHKNLFDLELFNTNIRIGEDVELWMRMLSHSKIYCIKTQTIEIVEHNQRTVYIQNKSCFQHLKLMKVLSKAYKPKLSRNARNTQISNSYFGVARYYIFSDKKFRALLYLVLSIFQSLKNPQNKHKVALTFAIIGVLPRRFLSEYKIL